MVAGILVDVLCVTLVCPADNRPEAWLETGDCVSNDEKRDAIDLGFPPSCSCWKT